MSVRTVLISVAMFALLITDAAAALTGSTHASDFSKAEACSRAKSFASSEADSNRVYETPFGAKNVTASVEVKGCNCDSDKKEPTEFEKKYGTLLRELWTCEASWSLQINKGKD